jgi:hypothetical protein
VGILDEDKVDPYEAPVGIRLGRIGRGEFGAELGGEFVDVIMPTDWESGLEESLRRQL